MHDRVKRILEMVDQHMAGEAPMPPKASASEVAKLDWVVCSTLSTDSARVLNELVTPILAVTEKQGLQQSTVHGVTRTNTTRNEGFPGVSFHSRRLPNAPWQQVPDEVDDPKKWGIHANIEWPDDFKLSDLSSKFGHNGNLRLDLTESTLIQPRPQLIASPLSMSATSTGPIHKQPAEALLWVGQLGGSCTMRCFNPKIDTLIRSDS
jgi:hypothetical protein